MTPDDEGRIDEILAIIDTGLQESVGGSYSGDRKGMCWRCCQAYAEHLAHCGLCGSCIDELMDEN